MKNIIKKAGRGIKDFMDEKINACKEVLSDSKNRKILGVIIMGIGLGLGGSLYVSGYIN